MKSVLVCIGFCFALMSLFYFEGYFLCGVLFVFVLSSSLIDFTLALVPPLSSCVSHHYHRESALVYFYHLISFFSFSLNFSP